MCTVYFSCCLYRRRLWMKSLSTVRPRRAHLSGSYRDYLVIGLCSITNWFGSRVGGARRVKWFLVTGCLLVIVRQLFKTLGVRNQFTANRSLMQFSTWTLLLVHIKFCKQQFNLVSKPVLVCSSINCKRYIHFIVHVTISDLRKQRWVTNSARYSFFWRSSAYRDSLAISRSVSRIDWLTRLIFSDVIVVLVESYLCQERLL